MIGLRNLRVIYDNEYLQTLVPEDVTQWTLSELRDYRGKILMSAISRPASLIAVKKAWDKVFEDRNQILPSVYANSMSSIVFGDKRPAIPAVVEKSLPMRLRALRSNSFFPEVALYEHKLKIALNALAQYSQNMLEQMNSAKNGFLSKQSKAEFVCKTKELLPGLSLVFGCEMGEIIFLNGERFHFDLYKTPGELISNILTLYSKYIASLLISKCKYANQGEGRVTVVLPASNVKTHKRKCWKLDQNVLICTELETKPGRCFELTKSEKLVKHLLKECNSNRELFAELSDLVKSSMNEKLKSLEVKLVDVENLVDLMDELSFKMICPLKNGKVTSCYLNADSFIVYKNVKGIIQIQGVFNDLDFAINFEKSNRLLDGHSSNVEPTETK